MGPAEVIEGGTIEVRGSCVSLGPCASRDHLTIRFEAGLRAVFTLAGFPHVLGPCNGDLLSVPMTELRGLLTSEAARYLPELAGPPTAK